VDADVGDPPARPRTSVGRPGALAESEVLADLVPAAQRRGSQRVERVRDVGLLRVKAGQLVVAAVRHASHEREPEVYALLVATSQAAARARPGEEARAPLLAIVFDGLTFRAHPVSDQASAR
jgi:hypothetical protein